MWDSYPYPSTVFKTSILFHADCLAWLRMTPDESLHAVVTDPPYGLKEFDDEQLNKKNEKKGGIWRIPPSFDGHERSPLPRFTALSVKEINELKDFFTAWSIQILRVLRPGGHVFVASNSFLSQTVFSAIASSGLEFRGEIIRLVKTLRGGDRPKNAEMEFPDVSTMPRGCFEPWGVFRKPLPKKMTVSECLRVYQTGGLRRAMNGNPLNDVIHSTRTGKDERAIANHPSLKPQHFLRQIVYAALPLGAGVILDPFAGSGSTLAAAEAIGYQAIGIERNATYYQMAAQAIPRLAQFNPTAIGDSFQRTLWDD